MEKLGHLDKELLLRVIAHYMDQDLRRKVMMALPLQYNRWMEQEVMIVGRACDASEKK